MKIFVTGATGFIGSAFGRAAKARGHSVAGLCRSEAAVQALLGEGVDGLAGTLANPPWAALRALAPEVCVHAAWIARPGAYLESPENEDYRRWSLDFLRQLAAAGVKQFVVLGTCAEYGSGESALVEDSSPIRPGSAYARAKHALHLDLRAALQGTGVRLAWVRIFYPYGEGEHPQRLCSSILRSLQQGEPVRLKTPDSVRDYIHIDDVAGALVRICEQAVDGAINLGTGRGVTVREVARRIAGRLGRPELIQTEPGTVPDPCPRVVADIQKLRGLGWEPRVSLETGLARLTNRLNIMVTETKVCPGCAGTDFSAPYTLVDQPAVLNYRFHTADAARRVPRGEVRLTECQGCGLVFNAAFNPALIPYDDQYENRQNCSPAFRDHLERLAGDLIERHGLRGGNILEVGCGKGDFLRLLCRRAGAAGVGYDTTYEPVSRDQDERVSFHRSYVTAAEVAGRFDAVICRHVVEHVPGIGDFLGELRRIAVAAGDPVVVLETPDFEWIAKNGYFWDVFYEHCNYFTRPTLRGLAERAGFRIQRHETVFGGQYQLLELRVNGVADRASPEVAPALGSLARFAQTSGETREHLEARLLAAGAAQGWAIWGAGAKGVALATQLACKPAFLVDSNPAKQGCVVPGSDIPIVSPDDPRVVEIPVLLVVNPNYAEEIKEALAARGFDHTLLAL